MRSGVVNDSSLLFSVSSMIVFSCGFIVGIGSITDYEYAQIHFQQTSTSSSISIMFIGMVLTVHLLWFLMLLLRLQLVASVPRVCSMMIICLCTYFIALVIWCMFSGYYIIVVAVDIFGGASLGFLSLLVPLYIVTQKKKGVLLSVYLLGHNLLYLPVAKKSLALASFIIPIAAALLGRCCLPPPNDESKSIFKISKNEGRGCVNSKGNTKGDFKTVVLLSWASISNTGITICQTPKLFEYFITPPSAQAMLLNITVSIIIPLFSMLPILFIRTTSRLALSYVGAVIIFCNVLLMCIFIFPEHLENSPLKSSIPLSIWMFRTAMSTLVTPMIYYQALKIQSYRHLTLSIGSFLYWSVRIMLPTFSALPLTLIVGSTGLLCFMFCVLYVSI